jgi:hypothetical protein
MNVWTFLIFSLKINDRKYQLIKFQSQPNFKTHNLLTSYPTNGTTPNIWLRPFKEDLSMTACLEHSASNL